MYIAWEVVGYVIILSLELFETSEMTDFKTMMKGKGKARGIVAVWERERQEKVKKKLVSVPLGFGRVQALQALVEMTATQLVVRPSIQIQGVKGSSNTTESIRTQWRWTSPHPLEGEPFRTPWTCPNVWVRVS